jgi:DNA-binding transcriptional LysR family regulator
VAGAGIALTPTFVVEEDLRDGRLRAILPEWRAEELVLSAVYPASRGLAARVRAFVDFVRERFGAPPRDRRTR